MTRSTRKLVLILLGVFVAGSSVTAYWLYEGFYNRILESEDIDHFNVEELRETHPTILRISMQPFGSADVLRTITTKKKSQTLIVFAHSGLSGLVKPNFNWDKDFELTVPDSVNEVRFGRRKTLIWKRGTTLAPLSERR
jgi:hypothetical protein